MDKYTLQIRQALPLDLKIKYTQQRIREFVKRYGVNGVYISFSGGKDSTVLLDIARGLYPDIPAVFFDTGLEYPEIKEFVRSKPNITIIRPEMTFKQVIEKHGYPVISKLVARYVKEGRRAIAKGRAESIALKRLRGECKNKKGNPSIFNREKWEFLLDAPFKISDECCKELKKTPAKKYEAETGRHPIMVMMADEGMQREKHYLRFGCNAFNSSRPFSMPMGFWTEQDVLKYIREKDIPYAKIYGDIVSEGDNKLFEDGSEKLKCTAHDRTGCIFCMFGVNLEKSPNRFERLRYEHPALYDYAINKLNLKQVLDYINVKY